MRIKQNFLHKVLDFLVFRLLEHCYPNQWWLNPSTKLSNSSKSVAPRCTHPPASTSWLLRRMPSYLPNPWPTDGHAKFFSATQDVSHRLPNMQTPYKLPWRMKAKERKEHQFPSVRVNWDISRPDSSAQWLHQYHRCRTGRNCWSYSGFASSTHSAPPHWKSVDLTTEATSDSPALKYDYLIHFNLKSINCSRNIKESHPIRNSSHSKCRSWKVHALVYLAMNFF